MTKIQEELKISLKLLKQEWQEDLEQYKKKFLYSSLLDKKEEGICWYPVNLKKTRFGYGERLIIDLERSDSKQAHLFQSGKSVSIFSNHELYSSPKNRINGVINQIKKDVMTVTLQLEELPEWFHKGKIGIDLLFDEASYREMEIALLAVSKADNSRLGELKRVLLGEKEAAFQQLELIAIDRLNSRQNEAVAMASKATDLAIIHGPPGTGKTTTLVAAIEKSLETNSQVLVCAPSNAAVDLLVEKLSERNISALRMGHPARVEEQILLQTLDAKIANHASYKDLKRLKKSIDELVKMGKKYKRSFGHEERMQRRRYFEEADRCRDEAKSLEDYIVYDIFQSSQVIACTLVGAASSYLKSFSFPVVFIDEAGQGLEAATWIPIQKAKKVVMAGDHLQLPPTIKSFEASKSGLGITLFEKAILRQPSSAVMLREQYRMHELIMGFSNRHFYQGELMAAPNTQAHYILEEEPVLEFVDTSGSGYNEQVEEESLSTYNLEEARFALNYLESFVKRIGLRQLKEREFSIGLIAPYRAQVRRLNELLFDTYEFPNLRSYSEFLTIDSIDGFQGRERDVMLISLVRSNAKGEIGFLADTRRMNVALTRAKRKMIVIGDSATLSSHSFYTAFLDYVEEKNCYKSVYEFME
ncbi:Superfamily I DNA/RNA helicase [Indibacter alkaliphilus LW1]|uniref:Superfamily I DNA/RNA helicase n=1 Tax=Indibacter alkaliphilus (strain CCUG 57479 / KCTC 22604 / LW1) TaxID=1189612 RepID=S2E165_INDAL|nr:AAA domain-containing protein [Indibacter alkaliphilus]EOZ95828.1 Superfamily I DNA/RNA helicase [Indibacter alkaliphilus LW1]